MTTLPKRADRKKKHRVLFAIKIFAVFLAALIFTIPVAGFLYIKNLEGKMQPKDPEQASRVRDVLSVVKKNEPANVLIVGSDDRGEEDPGRSDTIMVMRINPEIDRVQVVSIPRDSRVKIPGYARNKINAAYSLGDIELLIKTVESVSGLDLNYYVIVDFAGFEKMVNTVGGIDVDVEKRLVDRSLHMDLAPGYQHLNGHEALLYVRFRHDEEGDFGRIRRQQQFLIALLDKGKQIRNLFKLPTLANIMAENTVTNMTIRDMVGYGNFLRSLEKDQVETVMLPGEPKNINGVSYVVLDEEEKERIFANMRSDLSILATDDSIITFSDVSVEILNGAGQTGLAGKAQQDLETIGYKVTKIDNADRSDYSETLIFSSGKNSPKAAMVRESLKLGTMIIDDSVSGKADVRIVLGQDYVQLQREKSTTRL